MQAFGDNRATTATAILAEFKAILCQWDKVVPVVRATEDSRIDVSELQSLSPFEQIDRSIKCRLNQASVSAGASAESNAPNALEVPMQAVGEQSSIAGPVMGDLQQSLQMPSYSQLLKQREDCGLETLRPSRKRLKLVPKNHQPQIIGEAQAEGGNAADLTDVVVHVTIYHPVKNRVQQEFIVLGTQTLADLKDKIYCLKDKIAEGDQRPSSFFFINNTFYNDTRSENCKVYSRWIAEWAMENSWTPNKRVVNPELREEAMESALLSTIPFVAGEQYLFCHQGGCEHLVTFDQVEATPSCKDSSVYPIQVFQGKSELKKCYICNIHTARKVTHGDHLAPDDPCFFCEICYRQLHYSEKGDLLYDDFEQYDYYHE